MIKTPLPLLFGFLVLSTAFAGERGENSAFPHLKYFEIANDAIYVWYEPKSTELLIEKFPKQLPDPEAYVPILETKLGDSAGTICRVEFSWGPSDDPHFRLLRKTSSDWMEMGYISCDELTIPSSGSIYAWGWSNQMFAKSRKFAVKNGEVSEVEQPFYNVDMKTKTTKAVTLMSKPGGGEKVAALGADAQVHVLINQGDHYLVSTPFGLTGWVEVKEGFQQGSSLEGIYYRGD
ncbi:MAG: hypothetical protein AAF585_11695 [Verrucomicrobiota bacterium]